MTGRLLSELGLCMLKQPVLTGHEFQAQIHRVSVRLSAEPQQLLWLLFLSSADASASRQGMQFVGQEALLEQKQNGVYKRFTMFILEDHDTDTDLWPWWGEPIFRNGRYVGKTTSSAYSYTLERHVCLGFVHHFDEKTGEELVVTTDFINQGEYEIDIAGQRFQAKAKLYPFSSLFTQRRRKEEVELSGYQRE